MLYIERLIREPLFFVPVRERTNFYRIFMIFDTIIMV